MLWVTALEKVLRNRGKIIYGISATVSFGFGKHNDFWHSLATKETPLAAILKLFTKTTIETTSRGGFDVGYCKYVSI